MSRTVEVANRLLVRSGLEIRRKPPALVRSPSDLTMKLDYVAAHYESRDPGSKTVLQVGAFDGLANDPVLDAITRYGWSGVLVEPQLRPYERLARLHQGRPEVQTFNVAVSEHDGQRTLYSLDEADDLPDWAAQLASFDRAHFDRQARYLPGIDVAARVRSEPVATWTVDTLLRAAEVDRVDVLQIDTEGFDYEVLRLFDIPRRMPAIVCYEHQHLNRADRAAAARLLVDSGYHLAMNYVGGDTIAYRVPT